MSESKLKRYEISGSFSPSNGPTFDAEESPDGEWMRYSDHREEMERAAKAIAWFGDPNNCRHATPPVDEAGEFPLASIHSAAQIEFPDKPHMGIAGYAPEEWDRRNFIKGARYVWEQLRGGRK